MKDAISTLNKVLQKKETQEDDCDRYGKILANKIRKLSEDERLHMMYEIDGLFIKKRQSESSASAKYYNVPSPTYYGVPSSSPSPKYYVMSPSSSSMYITSNSSNSSYSESIPPHSSPMSTPIPITNDNIPIFHIPETSKAITEQVQPPSQQITFLSNKFVSPPRRNDI